MAQYSISPNFLTTNGTWSYAAAVRVGRVVSITGEFEVKTAEKGGVGGYLNVVSNLPQSVETKYGIALQYNGTHTTALWYIGSGTNKLLFSALPGFVYWLNIIYLCAD